ncbi:unnamed protein product [Bursaphelenchus xylophilus]|uniref:(pine wood nematode) hypothetical protein n=1 Tax=Bursaphelenchus xylophilus TaxID=6326 RepID=A0A1I7SCY6_BURXY|nr:unnamed protein product [Bursaphelenchus xylophilus]CAG9093240.1 unnamed protein product [Bursaphelenchus xylophilus]
MEFETISVRLQRSNPTIPWGFQLGQVGNYVIVGKVEPNSMAEKAGLFSEDIVEEVFNSKNVNVADANSKIAQALEVIMLLKRPVDERARPYGLPKIGTYEKFEEFDKSGQLLKEYDKNSSDIISSHTADTKFPTTAVDYQRNGQPRPQQGAKTPPATLPKPRTPTPLQQSASQSFVTSDYGTLPRESAPTQNVQKFVKTTTTLSGTPDFVNNTTVQNLSPGGLPYNSTTEHSEAKSNWNKDEGNVHKHFESTRTYTKTESCTVKPIEQHFPQLANGKPFHDHWTSSQQVNYSQQPANGSVQRQNVGQYSQQIQGLNLEGQPASKTYVTQSETNFSRTAPLGAVQGQVQFQKNVPQPSQQPRPAFTQHVSQKSVYQPSQGSVSQPRQASGQSISQQSQQNVQKPTESYSRSQAQQAVPQQPLQHPQVSSVYHQETHQRVRSPPIHRTSSHEPQVIQSQANILVSEPGTYAQAHVNHPPNESIRPQGIHRTTSYQPQGSVPQRAPQVIYNKQYISHQPPPGDKFYSYQTRSPTQTVEVYEFESQQNSGYDQRQELYEAYQDQPYQKKTEEYVGQPAQVRQAPHQAEVRRGQLSTSHGQPQQVPTFTQQSRPQFQQQVNEQRVQYGQQMPAKFPVAQQESRYAPETLQQQSRQTYQTQGQLSAQNNVRQPPVSQGIQQQSELNKNVQRQTSPSTAKAAGSQGIEQRPAPPPHQNLRQPPAVLPKPASPQPQAQVQRSQPSQPVEAVPDSLQRSDYYDNETWNGYNGHRVPYDPNQQAVEQQTFQQQKIAEHPQKLAPKPSGIDPRMITSDTTGYNSAYVEGQPEQRDSRYSAHRRLLTENKGPVTRFVQSPFGTWVDEATAESLGINYNTNPRTRSALSYSPVRWFVDSTTNMISEPPRSFYSPPPTQEFVQQRRQAFSQSPIRYRPGPGYRERNGLAYIPKTANPSQFQQGYAGPGFQPNVRAIPRQAGSHFRASGNVKTVQFVEPEEAQLETDANVAHLQYNSPLNLYSPASAAEAYKQQIGKEPPGVQASQPSQPSYLTSPTLQLIAEEEAGVQRRPAAPQQSASFKRIAQGVGQPL